MNSRHLAFSLACAVLPAGAHAAEFFQIKDENPLLRGIYLPMPGDMRRDAAAGLAATLSAENTINVENRGSERLFVDGEALTLRLAYDARLGSDWRYRLSLPVTHDSGGALDSAIERWHAWFGLQRGARPYYPRNRLTYSYSGNPSNPGNALFLNHPQTSIGDLATELGWYAHEDPSATISVWGGIEAPTGKAANLTGNGAWDASLWAHAAKRNSRWHLGAELGVVQPFGDEVFGGAARRPSVFARGAVTWIAGPAWSWRLQLEAQSARVKDTDLRFLGPSLVLSAGADVRLNGRWRLQWGFTEDAAVNTAPDVTFFIGVRHGGALR
jgi:hypothetical protein